LTKTGGLGDVAAALPAALRGLSVDARVLLPGYREVLAAVPASEAISLPRAGRYPAARLIEARHPNGVPLLILDCPEYFQRDGGPYLTAQGVDWPDNAQRFGLLSWVAALLASPHSPCD